MRSGSVHGEAVPAGEGAGKWPHAACCDLSTVKLGTSQQLPLVGRPPRMRSGGARVSRAQSNADKRQNITQEARGEGGKAELKLEYARNGRRKPSLDGGGRGGGSSRGQYLPGSAGFDEENAESQPREGGCRLDHPTWVRGVACVCQVCRGVSPWVGRPARFIQAIIRDWPRLTCPRETPRNQPSKVSRKWQVPALGDRGTFLCAERHRGGVTTTASLPLPVFTATLSRTLGSRT